MKLPNAEQAIVPEAKIVRYLLDLTSPQGKTKAVFFLGFGFTIDEWRKMADAFKQHAQDHEITSVVDDEHGIRYVIEGVLVTPDGRNPSVRVVWIIRKNEERPNLVTAYPL
jgi:hypothetical protein